MRIIAKILILIFFFNFLSIDNFAQELFDVPIDLKEKFDCKFNEFCEKFLQDINIEKYIRSEMKMDYVVVSLDECIDVALKNNFNIEINNHEYRSSKYEFQYTLTKFLPVLSTFSYLSDYSGQILVGGVLRDNFHETALSSNITVQHNLFNGGRDIFEAKAMKYFSKSKKHFSEFTKDEVVYKTAQYYYEMLLAKINIEIYLRNLIDRNAQLKLANNLKNSGFGTKFDVIRSENETALARSSLIDALKDFRLSQSRLANLMGIDVETALMPFEDEAKLMNLVDLDITLESLFESALQNREDLNAYKDLISQAKQVKYMQYTDFFPKPVVNFQQQFQGTIDTSVKPNYILSALLYWSPGENSVFGTLSKIKIQNEKIKIKKLEYENLYRNIKENIVNSLAISIYNHKQIEINKKRVEYSQESIKLAELRFNNGKGILLDVIQAQSQMTEARIQYVNSIIRYNISQLQLMFYSGLINREMVVSNY